MKKTSLPVDMRRSKRPLLKLPDEECREPPLLGLQKRRYRLRISPSPRWKWTADWRRRFACQTSIRSYLAPKVTLVCAGGRFVLYYSNLSGHVPLPPNKPLERGSTLIINHKFQNAGDTLQTLRLINLTLALATAFSTASFFCSSNCFMSWTLVASNATLISSLCFAFHSCRAISTATAKYSPQKGIEFRLYLT